MAKIISNTFKFRENYNRITAPYRQYGTFYDNPTSLGSTFLPQKTKLLAWGIFLVFFIENGTLGLLPPQVYFVYRNIRISDLLIYFLAIYSFFNISEYRQYYSSKVMIIPKLFLLYMLFQFIISVISYNYNVVEYFFRLKGIWSSVLIFPFTLLLARKGLPYLIRLMLPVAIISNIFYIFSSITGIIILPDTSIEKQSLPGGLEVFRVYGGTFFGEIFFVGIIYKWITDKFRLYQLPLVVLFVLPHILAFGRSAWIFLTFTIVVIFIWNALTKREARAIIKQAVLISFLIGTVIFAFVTYLPDSDYYTDALTARVEQGRDDIKYGKGTYGTRMANIEALVFLWQSSNYMFGVGMHPMWVLRPETEQELIYVWGFSDVRWASVLAAYGIVGMALAVCFQLFFLFTVWRLLKQSDYPDLLTFFLLMFMSLLMYDSFINYTYYAFSVSLWGFSTNVCFFIAVTAIKYEQFAKPIRNLRKLPVLNKYAYRYKKNTS